MPQKRLTACVGSGPVSMPKVYEMIGPTVDTQANVWVVLNEHNSHQNHWIDVAYSIEVPADTDYHAAYVIMECKSGYYKERAKLAGFCEEFFEKAGVFAASKPDYYFVAVFACEHRFDPAQLARESSGNLVTTVKMITTESCPTISRFLSADTTSKEDVEDITEELGATVR